MSELPASSPNPSPNPSSPERSPEATLADGLAALKRRAYPEAVALLSGLIHRPGISTALRLKAQMGLVKAYGGAGQTEAAIALCQQLRQAPQPKVQQWAAQTLLQWQTNPSPSPTTPDRSGFQPLGEKAVASTQSNTQPKTNASGFVPLSPPSAPASPTTPTETLRTPLESNPAAIAPNTPASEGAGEDGAAAVPAAAPEPDGHSLFHYAQLNQSLTPTPDSAADAVPAAAPSAPPLSSTDPAALPPATEARWQMINAGRLPRPQALRRRGMPPLLLGLTQGLTAIALFWVVRGLVQGLLGTLASLLWSVRGVVPIPTQMWLYSDHSFLLGGGLIALLGASPWCLEGLLTRCYGQKPLTIAQLKTHSAESARLMAQICRQRGWLVPALRQIPTPAPVIFSYGWLPRHTRIVVSQGLLEQLSEEELATLYAYELAHLSHWTLPLMSLVGVLLQLSYQVYWQGAQWGDRQTSGLLKGIATMVATLGYFVFWLLRKASLLLSRLRVPNSDRQAVEWTGNPNGLVRALIKIAIGTADTIAQVGYTPPLLESTDLLCPLGHETALLPGSLYAHGALPALLRWDRQNPYRHWLTLNNAHPLLGDRLTQLTHDALKLQLVPEMPLPEGTAMVKRRAKTAFWSYWQPFALQVAPYAGPLLGLGFALGLWFLGGIVKPLDLWQVSWFYGEDSLLKGSVFLGLGIGILVRINRYFPDIPPTSRPTADLMSHCKNALALPTDSPPVKLTGKLLGRTGIANGLCQDFILQTPTGLIKLHFLSSLGAVGNLLIHPKHPGRLVGQPLVAQGWFRRGATPWVDADAFLQQGRVVAKSNHPIWSVLLSLGFSSWGLYILFRGA
jgi:Zn-dependent protease with chaperone function